VVYFLLISQLHHTDCRRHRQKSPKQSQRTALLVVHKPKNHIMLALLTPFIRLIAQSDNLINNEDLSQIREKPNTQISDRHVLSTIEIIP
jgi:hypothetical protein